MSNFGGGFKFNTSGNTGGQNTGFGNFGLSFNMANQGQNQQPIFGQAQNNGATAQSPISSILQGYKQILQNGQNQVDSVFSCVFFNYCPPDLRNDYLRDEKNRELYNRYLSENPDPDNMVPVTIYGFNGLKERIESQKAVLRSLIDNDMIQQVVSSSHTMITECDRLLRECDEKQSRLEEQLIRVLGKIESTSTKSQVIVTNEEFMQKLVKLQREVSQTTYPFERFFIDWLMLTRRTGLRARLSTVYSALNTYGLPTQEESSKIENFDSMLNFLESQEDALEQMVSMLKKMQNDLQIILTDPYAHVYCEKF